MDEKEKDDLLTCVASPQVKMNLYHVVTICLDEHRLERKKGRLVDRFSDELFREKCGKKIDAGSLSLSLLPPPPPPPPPSGYRIRCGLSNLHRLIM